MISFLKGYWYLFKLVATAYVEIFRDTPMIVQAMIIYYGIRQTGWNLLPVVAGILVTVLKYRSIYGRDSKRGNWIY